MSEIDTYRHQCVGIVGCPSRFEIVQGRAHRDIPVYRIDEDAPDTLSFRAKAGDLLLGGGAGESAALRISIPEALWFYTRDDWDEWKAIDEIVHAYWTMNDAFVYCDGYYQRGWNPGTVRIENWLAAHILAFLLHEYPIDYRHHVGQRALEQDGSICRLPREDELQMLHGKDER